jgi:hypothetical protein
MPVPPAINSMGQDIFTRTKWCSCRLYMPPNPGRYVML